MNYRFCFRCGHELEKKTEYFLCKNCGFHFFQNPTPCNGVIIENKKEEILLVKRAAEPKKGFWDLTGGFTTIGETMEESVKREIEEELHIEINTKDLKYLASFHDKYMFMGEEYETLGFVYFITIVDQNIQPDDDISDYAFFSVSEIPWDTIAFFSVIKALKLWMKATKK